MVKLTALFKILCTFSVCTFESGEITSRFRNQCIKCFIFRYLIVCMQHFQVFSLEIWGVGGFQRVVWPLLRSLYVWSMGQSLVCVYFSSKVVRSSFLVACKQLCVCVCVRARVCVAPPSQHRSGHIPLSAALDNNRKRRGNPRAHFLCVQPAFFTMEQEEPGNCKRV